jgi:hypothetical protein
MFDTLPATFRRQLLRLKPSLLSSVIGRDMVVINFVDLARLFSRKPVGGVPHEGGCW